MVSDSILQCYVKKYHTYTSRTISGLTKCLSSSPLRSLPIATSQLSTSNTDVQSATYNIARHFRGHHICFRAAVHLPKHPGAAVFYLQDEQRCRLTRWRRSWRFYWSWGEGRRWSSCRHAGEGLRHLILAAALTCSSH